jgi:two-component system, cell cycle sensor histidine kinase and response regulator CckA
MIIVFFFYGLSFFLLGISISLQSRKGSEFKFGSYLWLLAAFGIVHGANEWLDMFLMLGKSYWKESGMEAMEVVRFFAGTASFVFLFLFGLQLLVLNNKKLRWVLPTSIGGFAMFVSALFGYGLVSQFDKQWFFYADAMMRYCLGFPGALVTAYAFLRQKRSDEIRSLVAPSIAIWLTGAAALFGIFAIMDGLVVEQGPFFPASIINYEDFMKIAGVPLQIFRTLCAAGLFLCILRILALFEIEKRAKLENAFREIIRASTREGNALDRTSMTDCARS